jgi:3-hydroxy acid dehydrogenase/malonic semialdehyde reductase
VPPVIVITGASAGIGAATARRYAKEPVRLALVARRKDKLEELQRELGSDKVSIYALDVTLQTEVEHTFLAIEKEHGAIDILVNNAGSALGLDPAQTASVEEWDKMIQLNLQGLLYCTRSALGGMVKRNRGHIVNLGSVAGSYPYAGGNVYCGTKAFVHQFSLSLRADLLGTLVRVTCIEPGLTGGTEFSHVRFRSDAARANKTYEGTLPLSPEDIAEAIWFCTHLPPHVNVNTIEMMPTCQAFAPLAVHRV